MPNPQQPELRRSDKGSATDQDQRQVVAETSGPSGHPHGSDKGGKGGGKGGGEGGGRPPDQQSVDERVAGT